VTTRTIDASIPEPGVHARQHRVPLRAGRRAGVRPDRFFNTDRKPRPGRRFSTRFVGDRACLDLGAPRFERNDD